MFNYLQSHKKNLVYLPLILYWIILFIATTIPSKEVPELFGSDKVKHYLAYGILAFLLNLALMFKTKNPYGAVKAFLFTMLICSVYGILDELHQMFIPGRSAEVLDFVADFIGALTGSLIVLYMAIKNRYNPA